MSDIVQTAVNEKDSSLCHYPQVLNGLSLIKLCYSYTVEKVEPKNKKRR